MDDFQLGQLAVVIAIDELGQNPTGVTALVSELRRCLEEETLINICQSLATMALGKMPFKNEYFTKGRAITLSDVDAMHEGLNVLSKELEGPDRENPSTEFILVKRAMARVNYAVHLFYGVIYGEPFSYIGRVIGQNKIPEVKTEVKHFKGIPLELLPKKEDGRTDFRINPENARKIYEILLAAEQKEAQFFWNHLPSGLREEKTSE